MQRTISGTSFFRSDAPGRSLLAGLTLLPFVHFSQQVHAEVQPAQQTIRVPDPVEFVPPAGFMVAESQLLIPPAPTAGTPASPKVLVPPLPQSVGEPALIPAQPVPAAALPEEWIVTITPLVKPGQDPMASRYESVYESIPFRRAEYLANPSYRHDTTVEILFGQMRQMVINRNDTPQRVVNPRPQLTQPYPLSKGELYSYWPLLQYSYPLPLLSPLE